jgi:membrane-bound lytic murein transglycosylase D
MKPMPNLPQTLMPAMPRATHSCGQARLPQQLIRGFLAFGALLMIYSVQAQDLAQAPVADLPGVSDAKVVPVTPTPTPTPAPTPTQPVAATPVSADVALTSSKSVSAPEAILNGTDYILTISDRGGSAQTANTDADLWARIRGGFAIPDLESDLVRDREQWYSSRNDYIARMVERSRKYLYYIVDEIERRKMPTELALLPFIESAFNPHATSTAKAAGMWQFIPGTGRDFQLKQNTFRDDRRDVLASTRAALDYLQKLYGMFGDWQLALAAYNWGEGSVSRAIQKNQRKGLGTSYTELSMPTETRYYIPKLQAVKNIVARPQSFNTDLPSVPNQPYFQTVVINRDIDVSLAARLSELAVDDFRSLNPSANKPVLLAAGTPYILLPFDNASVFEQNLRSYTKPLASWTAWQAPRTMRTADAAKQVGMNEAQLREVNHIPARMMVKAGSVLLVPRPAKHADRDVPEHVADNGQTMLTPEPPPLRKVIVKAKANETIASIAARHRLNAAKVAEWNELSVKSKLQANQSVVLYMAVKPSAKATGKSASGSGKSRAKRPAKPTRSRKAN